MSDYMSAVYYYSKWKIQEFLEEKGSMLKNWPMMESSLTGSAIIMAYIYFAKFAGPRFMRYRMPFYLREPMICYNFMMSILNLVLFFNFGRYELSDKYNLYNKSVIGADQISALRITQLNYIFYLSKFIQFSDTVFLLLLKKDSDASAFHILQRTLTPFFHWFGMKHAPGLQNNIFSIINSLSHTVIYTYYGMKMMSRENRKFSQFEKIIKNIKIIHFVAVIAHGALLYLRNTRAMHQYLSINFVPALLLLGLFINLYIDMLAKQSKGKESVILYEESKSDGEQKSEKQKKKRSTKEKPSENISFTNLSGLPLQKKIALF